MLFFLLKTRIDMLPTDKSCGLYDLKVETGGVVGGDEPFPGGEVTWCSHKIGGLEVEYVRADLVRAAMPANAADPDDPELYRLAEVLGMTDNGANNRQAQLVRVDLPG